MCVPRLSQQWSEQRVRQTLRSTLSSSETPRSPVLRVKLTLVVCLSQARQVQLANCGVLVRTVKLSKAVYCRGVYTVYCAVL